VWRAGIGGTGADAARGGAVERRHSNTKMAPPCEPGCHSAFRVARCHRSSSVPPRSALRVARRPAPANELAYTRGCSRGSVCLGAAALRCERTAYPHIDMIAQVLYNVALVKLAHVRRRSRSIPGQLSLPRTSGWGGARKGAGRKPGPHPRTPHRARATHYFGHPVHVTLRAGLGSLRSQLLFPTVRIAISRATRHAPERFRIVHFSVQSNHLHLIVEAAERRALTAGVHGLAIRITRYVNDLLMRRGSLWADRWHGRALKSPREVRNALVYVLANFRKRASTEVPSGVDPCSSGTWFHGWRGASARVGPLPLATRAPASERGRAPPFPTGATPLATPLTGAPPFGRHRGEVPVSEPCTWLLREGFLKAGRIRLDEAPRTAPVAVPRTPTRGSSTRHG